MQLRNLVLVILIFLVGLVMQTVHSPASGKESNKIFLPMVSRPHCATASIKSPAEVIVGRSFKATTTLHNLECSDIKNPLFLISGGHPMIWPKPHPPYALSATITSGSKISFTHTIYAPDTPVERSRISGGVSFWTEDFERVFVSAPVVYVSFIKE